MSYLGDTNTPYHGDKKVPPSLCWAQSDLNHTHCMAFDKLTALALALITVWHVLSFFYWLSWIERRSVAPSHSFLVLAVRGFTLGLTGLSSNAY